MKLVPLVCVILLLGCVGNTTYSDLDRIDLRIQNDAWSASRVRIYCDDGQHIATIHALRFAEINERSVRLPAGCPSIFLEVIAHGRSYISESRPVIAQEIVCARVNSVIQTTWFLGCYT